MSTQRDWIISHVERCLEHIFDDAEIIRDDEGEYPFRWESAACWVQVLACEPVFVRVYAHAAHHVRRSAKLLSELNDVNTRAITAHAYWVDGLVIVEQVLPPAGLEPVTLEQACASVGRVAADIGPLIAFVHGAAPRSPRKSRQRTADGERAPRAAGQPEICWPAGRARAVAGQIATNRPAAAVTATGRVCTTLYRGASAAPRRTTISVRPLHGGRPKTFALSVRASRPSRRGSRRLPAGASCPGAASPLRLPCTGSTLRRVGTLVSRSYGRPLRASGRAVSGRRPCRG